jgi:hypothetical protein
MADLEAQLRALEIEWPETPDIATAIRPHLHRKMGTVPILRWRLVVAAVVAVLLGGVAAIEPARSAVLEFLGLKSVKIERRAPDPPPPAESGLDLGEQVTLEQARRRAGFNATPPTDLGEPDEVWIRDEHFVSFVYGRGDDLLLVSEALAEPFIEKSVGPGVNIEEVRDGDARGYFLSGAPHGFGYVTGGTARFEDQRLAGNTLILERDGLLIRIEGEITKERALQIARSVSATSAQPSG